MTVSAHLLDLRHLEELSLSVADVERASELLGRVPNRLEMGIIGALWSEHCGYRSSKRLLRRLPTTGPRVVQGPGENAGVVDIGGGLAVAFKIESHNHPSAIEPYQGAATGVGGILRDVFAMGARPIALLDSLRFGPLDDPHQRYLFQGVVAGIGGYGNCVGVPTVGGEVAFDDGYRHNCIVNAMCVGVVERSRLLRAAAAGPGNPVLLVGADTGRDGIHGATFASAELDARSSERRPAVQVGDPFLEKCLLEACLELAGDPRVVALQDLGAAGLASSAAELARRGDCGIDIDTSRVPRRETGMTPYEVVLSESQERMLVVVRRGDEEAVRSVFAKWGLHSEVIGVVTDTGRLVVRDGDTVVADLPLRLLVDEVPLRDLRMERPADLDVRLARHPLPDGPPWPPGEALLRLLASPNLGSRRPIFRRYDHQVGNDTIVGPGGDAALLRVRPTNIGLAVTTDGNSRYVALDPRRGAAIAVCEAARNVVAVGATPLAITNCLNFGNPEKPDVAWQLAEAVEGIAEACEALGVPVVSGNVSLYNDTEGTSIPPTPVIGMVGLLEDVGRHVTPAFVAVGDRVGLVGPLTAELGGSEYQRLAIGEAYGPPPRLDFDLERRVQAAVREAIAQGLLRSAHDCAEGGLAVAIAECCLAGGLGVDCRIAEVEASSSPTEVAGILFGESQSRFVVSFSIEAAAKLRGLMDRYRVPFRDLGTVEGKSIHIRGALDVPLAEARRVHERALLADDKSPLTPSETFGG